MKLMPVAAQPLRASKPNALYKDSAAQHSVALQKVGLGRLLQGAHAATAKRSFTDPIKKG